MGRGLACSLCLPTPSGQHRPRPPSSPGNFFPVLGACGGDCFEQHRLWSSLSPMQHLHVLEASSSQQQPAGPCFHPSVAEEEGRGKVASLCGSAARWRPALTSCPSSFFFFFFFFKWALNIAAHSEGLSSGCSFRASDPSSVTLGEVQVHTSQI